MHFILSPEGFCFYIQKNATGTEIELGSLPDLIKKVQFGIMPQHELSFFESLNL